MYFMKYLIKIGPEITIKSDGVRKLCIKKLKRNIGLHLDDALIEYRLSGNWDRIILEVADIENQATIKTILSSIMGIGYFSPVEEISITPNMTQEEIYDEMAAFACSSLWDILEWKSFVVRVKRSGNHNFRSVDVERAVGGRILARLETGTVRLDTPDITVKFEIKDEGYFLVWEKIQWQWWYPVWFQDRVLSLISGGFDSSVSSYQIMKRGCEVDYLFFNLWGSAHELWVKQVSYYLWKNFSVSYKRAKFITIPFEEVVQEILTKVHHSYRGVLLKRCMLQVASRIAERHYSGIVKGDSIGQVSSQTLANMSVIDEASSVLTLRPLITMNKQEIIDISKRIGTYDFAKSMPEYCGVISDKPSVRSKREEIHQAEENFDMSVLDTALDNRKIIRLSDILTLQNDIRIEEVSKKSPDDIVIDLRETQRVRTSPLSQKWVKDILEIPFFEINHRFEKLDVSKNYLFYCDKGILSHLHGLYLKEKWFTNIKVFRP